MITGSKTYLNLPDTVLAGVDAIFRERNTGLRPVPTRAALLREIIIEYVSANAPTVPSAPKVVRVRTRPAAK